MLFESESGADMTSEMAPKQKGGQKPKANTAEEVEETFQAVVCSTVRADCATVLGLFLVLNADSLTFDRCVGACRYLRDTI